MFASFEFPYERVSDQPRSSCKSSRSIQACIWTIELVATIRAGADSRSRSSRRLVRRKGARWFTARTCSYPSVLSSGLPVAVPALLTRTWMRGWRSSSRSASERTSPSEAKSAVRGSAAPGIRDATASSRPRWRPTGATSAPRRPSFFAPAAPMPELAPVTTTVRPASGCSARLGTVSAGSVVVTGASTGIGEATAFHLASLGFDVLAGVRKDEDAERLRGERVQPVKLDVTEATSIASARDEIEQAGGGRLAGLVNNAGIAVAAPLEYIPIDRLRQQLEVNLIGQVAVTQALLPFLRAGKGRIVNVSSIGGRIALPLASPYAASKFGLEAVSDSLRRELRHLGVDVVVIEPGGIKTPIWMKGNAAADEMLKEVPPEAEQLYGELVNAVRSETKKIETERGLPPSAVAEVIGTAMIAGKPKTRYLVGRDAKLRAALAKWLPDRTMDSLIGRALSG